METIGERLREERERAGLSQQALGEIGGVLKQAQLKYEHGKRKPDAAYIAAIAAAGLDILYILTGERAGGAPPEPALTPEQRALLDNYEACSPTDRAFVRKAAATAAKFHALTSPRKTASKK